MKPGARLGMAEAMAGDVIFMPCSIRAWNPVTLEEINTDHSQTHLGSEQQQHTRHCCIAGVSYPPRASTTNWKKSRLVSSNGHFFLLRPSRICRPISERTENNEQSMAARD